MEAWQDESEQEEEEEGARFECDHASSDHLRSGRTFFLSSEFPISAKHQNILKLTVNQINYKVNCFWILPITVSARPLNGIFN